MYEERIKRGSEWLDKNHPGWVERIDLDSLYLGHNCRCVLGQIVGGSASMCLFQEEAFSLEFGFSVKEAYVSSFSNLPELKKRYVQLTREWKSEILKRRQAQKVIKEALEVNHVHQ